MNAAISLPEREGDGEKDDEREGGDLTSTPEVVISKGFLKILKIEKKFDEREWSFFHYSGLTQTHTL